MIFPPEDPVAPANDPSPYVSQAVRFDTDARAALDGLGPRKTKYAMAVAMERLREMNSTHESTHELQSLDSLRARAALAGCRESYYADVLAGRRSGSDGTVVRWLRAWADAGLRPLDAHRILDLPT